jgi:tetratricopeptide (TPR) repeat protein
LGSALAQAGNYRDAEPYLLEALELRQSLAGPEDDSIAVDLTNLGNLYSVLGQPEKAERLLRRALAIYRARVGDEHQDVGDVMTSLATLTRDRDPEGARQLYESALANFRESLTESHPKSAMALDNLGSILRQMGDYAAAEPLIRAGLARRRALLPPDHPDIVQSLNNLARLLLSRGAAAEAAEHYREGIAIWDRTGMSPQHEKMIAMRVGLGRSLTAVRELDESRRQLEIAEAAVTGGALASNRIRQSLLEGWVELYQALHAIQPDAGHDARADESAERLRAWRATTQPAAP